jgi:hypothetical protein
VPSHELRQLADYDLTLLAIRAEAREKLKDKAEQVVWEALTDPEDKYRRDRASIFVPKPESVVETKPDIDIAGVYAARFKALQANNGTAEARARAYDYAVGLCRDHYGVDLEEAKRRVFAALARD